MSSDPFVIDLSDKKSLCELLEKDYSDENIKKPIENAIHILKNYKPNFEMTPKQIRELLMSINIDERHDPKQMHDNIQASDSVYILEKKYLKTTITRTKFKIILHELLRILKESVPESVIGAIAGIIRNFADMCCTLESFNIAYKSLCFRFFTTSENNQVIVLIVNIHFADVNRTFSCIPLTFFSKKHLNLEFLGTLVKTTFNN